jgi:flagellar biosynthesis protein
MKNEKIGVALEYSGAVPTILAVARGVLFEHLIRIAHDHKITIYENPDLAQVLAQVPVGTEIPEVLFRAVSEVLAFCYRVNADFKVKLDGMGIL